ncbi:LON peptidase substrate-binding domain-containing protein [Chthonobacter albigriseus]|uniref:LON peptidase substrate-binding domain-containing protein n=1 Tax=Chthonobacter albigriseus TaxID=1683161 RepID=UPI0015EEBC68|nr:LON peptidase substrate-binding domain-containing protein [Chthonobacter albigriseus]
MMAGNARYDTATDLPRRMPVFPLSGALLLPRGQLPLNIFEPRYIAMVDAALAGDRVIGMVQPRFDAGAQRHGSEPALCNVGCAGRITTFNETGDGRYLITLTGITRFRIEEEESSAGRLFRVCRVTAEPFEVDFLTRVGESEVDRPALLRAFQAYLSANDLEADWESVEKTPTEALVNALSMMSPFGPPEKQALLEAPDLKTRADTLIAITEFALARAKGGGESTPLQ